MSLETRPIARKNLTGFSVSPNPEAHDLESVLGIRFEQTPARIELGFRNRLVFLARERDFAPLRAGSSAFYDRDYDAFFTRPGEANRMVAWHESMHSYTESKSSGGLPTLGEARNLLLESLGGEGVGPSRMEKVAVQATLNEGISEWAAVRTAMEIGTEYEIAEASEEDRLIRSRERSKVSRKTPLEVRHAVLNSALGRLQNLLTQNPGLRTPFTFNESVEQISQVSYLIGYYFVSEAVAALQKIGFSIPSALDHLIEYPPSRTKDLKNPKGFILGRIK